MTFSARTRQRGVSQRELAARLGVSQAQVARIEASANPTVGSLARYLDGLELPLVALAVRGSEGLHLVCTPRDRERPQLGEGPAGGQRRRTTIRNAIS